MLKGYIDALTSAGLCEGWAYDEQNPLKSLLVAIVDDADNQLAAGLANLYRRDLAESNLGYGWCHFRLFIDPSYAVSNKRQLKLIALETNVSLHAPETLRFEDAAAHVVSNVSELVNSDPTVIKVLDEIDSFEEVFNTYIRAKGVDAFVRAAYVYVLGRSIDEEGIVLYSRLIRQTRLSPYAMLRTLADSAEFREKPRSLLAPTQPGFPFRTVL